VYVIGGIENHGPCKTILRFDLNRFEWSLVTNLPQSVHFHSASVSAFGQILFFGGISSYLPGLPAGTPQVRTNSMYSIWVDVPPLRELALQSVIHYVGTKKLLSLDDGTLQQFGLTTNMIKRIRH
jgi:hypothetical protein